MPLFARRLFYLENPSKKITEQEQQQQQHDDATFRIEHTGEVFDDRTLFENVKKIYELERWTCQCTSRSSLTHRDALQSEIETRKSLPTLVPTYFNKTILQLVHHSESSEETNCSSLLVSPSLRCETFRQISRRNFDRSWVKSRKIRFESIRFDAF